MSTATSLRFGVRSRSCPVFPPGAAQASSTLIPGRASSSIAASWAPASWMETTARLESDFQKPGRSDTATGFSNCTAASVHGMALAATPAAANSVRYASRARRVRSTRNTIGGCSLFAARILALCRGQACSIASTSHAGCAARAATVSSTRANSEGFWAMKRRSTAFTRPLAPGDLRIRVASTAARTVACGGLREYSS